MARRGARGRTRGVASRRLRRRGGHEERQRRPGDDGEPSEGGVRHGHVSATGRSTSTRRSCPAGRRRTGGNDEVHRGLQRQRGVLRQGPPGARGRPADRPRPRRADRLDGRALDRPRLRRADRQDQRPEREEPPGQPREPALRPGAQLHAAVAVRHHGHRLQPEEDRAQAHERQRPVRPEVQGPRDDVQRVARLRRPRAAGHGQGPDDGLQGRLPPGDREDRQGEP